MKASVILKIILKSLTHGSHMGNPLSDRFDRKSHSGKPVLEQTGGIWFLGDGPTGIVPAGPWPGWPEGFACHWASSPRSPETQLKQQLIMIMIL